MGPMVHGRSLNRRLVAKWAAIVLAGLMIWSLIAAPPSTSQALVPEEPFDLSTYSTEADAAPVRGTFDHQVAFVAATPAIAHSTSQVIKPSTASGTAWVIDNGLVNSVWSTSFGTEVFSEASATAQPGQQASDEFGVPHHGLTIGAEDTGRFQTGRSFAEAESLTVPRGYANSYMANFYVLPKPGSPQDPPGTFDPGDEFNGEQDPNPEGQMAYVAIGSIASTTESLRDGDTVKSIAVSEANDINIGNRTGDNRCTGCISIDYVRAEAYAEANGAPGGAHGAFRVILGRMCRRAFNADAGGETDACIGPQTGIQSDTFARAECEARAPEGHEDKCQNVPTSDEVNEFFAGNQVWQQLPGFEDTVIGISLHAGRARTDEDGEPVANFAEPGEANDGQEARAVAEGLRIAITIVSFGPSNEDIAGSPLGNLDQDPDREGLQVNDAVCFTEDQYEQLPEQIQDRVSICPVGAQTITTGPVRDARLFELRLATASAAALARPGSGFSPGGDDGDDDGPQVIIPEINIPEIRIPEIRIPEGFGSGGPSTTVVSGYQGGPLELAIDWSSISIKPWPATDMAKGIVTGGILGLGGWLLRRRLRIG